MWSKFETKPNMVVLPGFQKTFDNCIYMVNNNNSYQEKILMNNLLFLPF